MLNFEMNSRHKKDNHLFAQSARQTRKRAGKKSRFDASALSIVGVEKLMILFLPLKSAAGFTSKLVQSAFPESFEAN